MIAISRRHPWLVSQAPTGTLRSSDRLSLASEALTSRQTNTHVCKMGHERTPATREQEQAPGRHAQAEQPELCPRRPALCRQRHLATSCQDVPSQHAHLQLINGLIQLDLELLSTLLCSLHSPVAAGVPLADSLHCAATASCNSRGAASISGHCPDNMFI